MTYESLGVIKLDESYWTFTAGNITMVGTPEKPLPVAVFGLNFGRRSFSGRYWRHRSRHSRLNEQEFLGSDKAEADRKRRDRKSDAALSVAPW
jgi:hypothetical protein